jgi:SAM-dependent methyltransferase
MSNKSNHIDTVISTCIERDASIWRVAAPKILEHVKSKNYMLIVPKNSVEVFRCLSPVGFVIVAEEEVLNGVTLEHLRQELPAELKNRAGWYFQQFLKIECLRSLGSNKLGLIWDADTVPVKDLNFINNDGKLIYRMGLHEPKIHKPYFDIIEFLLGIKSSFSQSFISQCFPAHSSWVNSFCTEVEKRHNDAWWRVILKYIIKNPSFCGFSEYESLGTFIAKNFQNEICFRPGKYIRPFNTLYTIDELDSEYCRQFIELANLEYAAFDSYDDRRTTGLNIGCGSSRILKSFDGGLCINVDKYETLGSDVSADLEKGLPFKDAHFSHIIAHNILEHIDDLVKGMEELDRLLAPGGILQIEVPHIGSFNHGTDATHKRGLTFNSFDFLFKRPNYLYPQGNGPFDYRLITFNRENIINGQLTRESFNEIIERGTYKEWLERVYTFEIPGTFGFIFQKIT